MDDERTSELQPKIICVGYKMQSAINEPLQCVDVTFEVMSSKTCHDVTTQLSLSLSHTLSLSLSLSLSLLRNKHDVNVAMQ
jgi:hypothetical protein